MVLTGIDMNQKLASFVSEVPGLEVAALVSFDGLIVASSFPKKDAREDRIAAMSSALLSIASVIADELRRGKFERAMIEGTRGSVILLPAGDDFLLVAVCSAEARLGMLLYELERMVNSIAPK